MKTETKKLPKSKIEIEFEVPVEEWEEFIDEAAKELSADLKVAGFRPGNIPRNIVEREVGLARLLERGSELAVRKIYIRALIDERIEAIGTPKITILKMAPANPFVFKAESDILPEVELPDYEKIVVGEKPKVKKEITAEDKEIEQSLEWLRQSRAQLITVARGAEKGDRVEIDFVAAKDGVKIDKAESKNHPFVLGEGRFVPGFEDKVAGMKEGDEREFQITFPEDYYQKSLAGQKVDFKVKMKLVQEQKLSEANDDFAKSLGNFESLDDLKQNIKDGIVREKQEKEKQNWRQKIIEQISKGAKMDIPEILISQEIENMIGELKSAATQLGIEWEKYLQELKKTEDEIKKESRPQAEKRVKNILVLKEIAKKEKIEVKQEEIEAEVNNLLRHYESVEKAENQVDIERLKEYTYGVLRNEKVFRKLEEFNKNN